MRRKITKWLYRSGLLQHYSGIDSIRYLKRLASDKGSDDGSYYSEKDRSQFAENGEVLLRFRFLGRPCRMYCRPNTHLEANLIRNSAHALRLQEIVAEHLREGAFVDIGANIGSFVIPLAKAFPQCRVIAFEPNPSARQRLEHNAVLNGLTEVDIRPEGVGDVAGQFTLFGFSAQDTGQSSFLPPTHFTESPVEISVPVVTLDASLGENDIPIDVIKIDVQGLELAVLQGGRRVISKHRPVILLEHEDSNFSDATKAADVRTQLMRLFNDLRYDVFYISRKDPNMLFPVRWEASLDGDLLALPRMSGCV